MSEEQGDPPDGGPPGGGFLLHGPFGAWPEETARRDRLQGLIRRQARHLFHIAFWLTGSVEEAERRSQDALQRLLGETAETSPAAGTPLPDGGVPPSGEASSDA
ncbi:MAG TPA: hypothetical protein VNL37_00080, partial [Candidatus Polarisedimenticolia bacterium]|nr:hypothetical protein [Candidatus Polarisedimenticolia bacterium]